MEQSSSTLLRRIVLHAAKLPIIYLLTGFILIALSDIDKVFPITYWKQLFNITDKLGNIFISFAILTFIYQLLAFICLRSEQKFMAKQKIIALIIASIRKGARVIFLLIAINIVLHITETHGYIPLGNDLLQAIIIALIGWVAIQISYTVDAVIHQYIKNLPIKDYFRGQTLYTRTRILRNIANFVIIIITIAAILMSFDSVRNIGISLLASAGFLTAIAGLSAQKTLGSLFCGLQIALSQQLKIGDFVVIENTSGTIEEINFTYVILKLSDNHRLMLPINYFVEKPFENWSHDSGSVCSSLNFHVDFTMPIAPLREELDRTLQTSSLWDGRAMKLEIANLHNHSVEVRMQISAANADDLSTLRAQVREKILDFIRSHYPDHFPSNRSLNKAIG